MESKASTRTSPAISRSALIQSGDSTIGRCSPSPFLRTYSSRYRPESVDTRDQGVQIKHGILPDYNFRAKSHIHSVLFDPKNQHTTVHHVKGVSVHHRRKLESELEHDDKTGDVIKLLSAWQHGLYVGVCKSHLKLLNSSFKCFYMRESESRITSAVYNTWSGQIITSGPGNLTVS